jgi:thiol-disulfide isomerase/thioredoxin
MEFVSLSPCVETAIPARLPFASAGRYNRAMAAPNQTLSSALQLAFVVGAAVMVYSFVATARESETRRKCAATCLLQPSYAGAERTLPKFEVQDLDGHLHGSAEWEGKVLVLNFWTKTCGPCLEEMPSFAQLARVLASRKDVVVAAISTDEEASEVKDTLKSVLREPPVFETLIDPESAVVHGKFGTDLFPETWIVDARGVIRARFDGARDWSDAAVVEVIDEIRAGTYCPLSIHDGKLSANSAAVKLCQSMSGAADE